MDVDGCAEVFTDECCDYDLAVIAEKMNKPVQKWQYHDVETVQFNTVNDAENFYRQYACLMEFSVRKDELRMSSKYKVAQRRRWVCAREGKARVRENKAQQAGREPRRVSRCGCKAAFRVHYCSENQNYNVHEFEVTHNHDLASEFESHFLRSRRLVTPTAKHVQTDMRRVGVGTARVMDYMVVTNSGYKNVGFTRKDLYNWVDSDGRVGELPTDYEKSIAHLTSRAQCDPDFYCRYAVDGEDTLRYLFWADGGMRRDYAVFGDVICFDATYNTNGYKLPYVVILGVNHHFMTTIFGCALVRDESEDCFKWLLSRFVHCMGGKMPTAVITDGAPGFKLAIESELPAAHHRTCSWHLMRNCKTNVKESPAFAGLFAHMMLNIDDPNELEAKWHSAIPEHGLQQNQWVKDAWDKREYWAIALLKNTFFAGMTSTQRAEGMHAFQKRFLSSQLKLYDFVRRLDVALERLREAEVQQHFYSRHTIPQVVTHLKHLERHAAELYTPQILVRIRQQILEEPSYFVVGGENVRSATRVYQVRKYASETAPTVVKFDDVTGVYDCSCKLLSYTGLPCSHIFAVLKLDNAVTILASCILRRWTKDAKKDPCYISRLTPDDVEAAILVKRAQLAGICNKLAFFASRASKDGYLEMKDQIGALTVRAAELFEQHQSTLHDDKVGRDQSSIIRDPIRVMGKKTDESKKMTAKKRKRLRKQNSKPEALSVPGKAIQVRSEPQTTENSLVNIITPSPPQQTSSYPHPASSSSPFQSYSAYPNSAFHVSLKAQPVNPSTWASYPKPSSFQYMLQSQMLGQPGNGLTLGQNAENYFNA